MSDKTKVTRVQELVYELKVCDAAREHAITADPNTLMSQLREILRSNRISGIPVLENGELTGIISIEDFIKWLASRSEDCPIRDKMTTKVETLYPDEPLIHAVSKLDRGTHLRIRIDMNAPEYKAKVG